MPAQPANQPPAFSSAASASVAENVTGPVYQAVASDPNGDALTYAIVGGADAARFTLSATGQLAFVDPPNYDLPADADRNNVYEVQIGASDGKASTTLAVAVTVTNSKEGVYLHRLGTGFTDPVAIASKDPATMLVAEKAGAIYSLNMVTGVKTLLLQLGNVGPVGVVAMSYGPGAFIDGSFFVMYTTQTGFLVVTHFARNSSGTYYEDAARPVLAINAPNYAGGGALIYASEALYAAIGDGGGIGDPSGSAQNDSSMLGKLLRIVTNPDPYAGAAPAPYLVSTVAKGLHRPRGGMGYFAGTVFADRGQDLAEEIDLLPLNTSGANFGWPYKEGSRSVAGTPPAGLTDPVLEYYRTGGLRTGHAIIGGALGPGAVASLRDQFLFADESGAIFTVKTSAIAAGKTLVSDVFERRDADFAPTIGTLTHPVVLYYSVDAQLFLVDAGGDIFRIEAGS
ncbi:cadherin repeat domain-containing protein [uncultured Sphingomonas sp.]|uniref:cadherin repeat domain-containing protein n=1 Tax=uncultured Sphingomonas sp. TaxID=158754 RepID=UPI0025E08D66|nr:cadherin repeat domain-containing protein [uncultured Sphingomonas sp.]